MTTIPVDGVAATNLLNEAGWTLPDGATTRQKIVNEETTVPLELNLLVLREGLRPGGQHGFAIGRTGYHR